MGAPIRADGWYRLTARGCWERVSDTDAETEIAAGGGQDLVHVQAGAFVEVPLF
jgi:hypothetical protein